MGQDDDINTSLAHIVLCCVAGNGLRRCSGKSFTHPGMHANFFIHGVIGFLHFQSGTFNNDFTQVYGISLKASKYLALPCLMADLYHQDQTLSTLHLISGVVPFVMAVTGHDNPHLGHLMIACNVVSLCYYAHKHENEWAWYTAGGAVLAYFVTFAILNGSNGKEARCTGYSTNSGPSEIQEQILNAIKFSTLLRVGPFFVLYPVQQ